MNSLKLMAIYFATVLVTGAVLYGIGVFVSLEPDVTEWTRVGRLSLSYFSTCAGIVVAAAWAMSGRDL